MRSKGVTEVVFPVADAEAGNKLERARELGIAIVDEAGLRKLFEEASA